jgi:hypothetical protein
MSSTPHAESESPVLTAITSVTRGRDVLAALAMAWSSSASQLDPGSESDKHPLLTSRTDCASDTHPSVRVPC